MRSAPSFVLILFVAGLYTAQALDNGLALTPPMGWLTWTRFLCETDCTTYPDDCISEKLIKDQADRMAADGYKDAGYEYVIIDDCWLSRDRDTNAILQPDPTRFPSGIKALVDYVHNLGLKFGIYEDVGTNTCAGFPGSYNHYDIDAATFAAWGVDYVKFDGCNQDPTMFDTTYPAMSEALNKTGRPMVYSCEWPLYQGGNNIKPDYDSIAKYCNLWRAEHDIADQWSSVTDIIDRVNTDQANMKVGPGAWNDPDMLVVGGFGLSEDEEKAQMAIWAILAAPLLMSNDLRNIKDSSKAILLNKDVLAINQDKLGIMGKRVIDENPLQYYTRPVLPEGSVAIVYFNRNNQGTTRYMSKTLKDLGLTTDGTYSVKELFSGTVVGNLTLSQTLTYKVNPSGVAMFKATLLK